MPRRCTSRSAKLWSFKLTAGSASAGGVARKSAKPTPMVTSKTVSYIHALVIDTLTFHSADATYARAIAN